MFFFHSRSRELQRRLSERIREADSDSKDRSREQEELEELKNKIFSGEYENPTQEFERLKKEHENMYKPKLIIDVNQEANERRERERLERETEKQRLKQKEFLQREKLHLERESVDIRPKSVTEFGADSLDSLSNDGLIPFRNTLHRNHHHQAQPPQPTGHFINHTFHDEDSHLSDSGDDHHHDGGGSPVGDTPVTPPMTGQVMSFNLGGNAKKKKIEVKDVFNNEEEGEEVIGPKRRKLVPLDYDEKNSGKLKKSNNGNGPSPASGTGKDENAIKSSEEKRRHIKNIIDRIPTEKEDLFKYPLDWDEIDNALMEKKIRPWINKKIIEYIGEPEPTLVDFICSKVMAASLPQSILDDVQMVRLFSFCCNFFCSQWLYFSQVLDEEAEVFVVKMWRLLIYEAEAKKIGLVK